MPNDDRIYQAYTGGMGEAFRIRTRERIDWILAQAGSAGTVLDIGCSQGIIPLLLAQRGCRVVGLDIREESIRFAKELAAREYPEAAKRVRFILGDFMQYRDDARYDVILMSEVLEHLEEPHAFLERAARLLGRGGLLIVTVPFGLSPHPDHRSTFYLLSALRLIGGSFAVQSIHMRPGWLGLTAALPQDAQPLQPSPEELIELEEELFLEVQRQAAERAEELGAALAECNKKYAALNAGYDRMKEWHRSAAAQAAAQEQLAAELKGQMQLCEQEAGRVRAELLGELAAARRSLIEEGRFLAELERSVQRLEQQNEYLRQENAACRQKLSLITDTWFGRLGIRGYRLLRRIRGRLGRRGG